MTCKGFGVLAMWIKSAQDFSCVQSLFKSLLQKKLMTLAKKSIHYLTCSVFKYVYTAENSPGFHLVHCFEIYSIWCLYVTSVSPSTPLTLLWVHYRVLDFSAKRSWARTLVVAHILWSPPPPSPPPHRQTHTDGQT